MPAATPPTSGPVDRSKLLSFDLETTGPNPATALVVTSALLRITGAEVEERQWLADPGIDIPAEATAVHGISTEHARSNGQDHAQVVADTIEGIRSGWDAGYTLVVFNAPFDLTILHRLDPTFQVTGPVLDPYVIDRAIDPYRKGKRTLTALCEHYDIALDGAHDAAVDALAAARLAWKLANHEQVRADTWTEFNDKQAAWHAERQESFRAYLERQGRPATDVNTAWPIGG